MWNLRCWFTKNQKKNNAGAAERMHKMLLRRERFKHPHSPKGPYFHVPLHKQSPKEAFLHGPRLAWLRHLKMKNSTFESNISQLMLIANIRTYRFSS